MGGTIEEPTIWGDITSIEHDALHIAADRFMVKLSKQNALPL